MNATAFTISRALIHFSLITSLSDYALASDRRLDSGQQTDHLVPIDSKIDSAYMRLLAARLFLTRANYARVLVKPSTSEGEFTISIYSRPSGDGKEESALTCVKAEKNLWYSMFDRTEANKQPVRVTRTDAPFPRSAAVVVSQALQEMLHRTRPADHIVEILDGTDIEFSVEGKKPTKTLSGLLAPYAHGSHTKALHQLTKMLIRYCDAGLAERQEIVREIHDQATGLERMESSTK